MSNSGKRRALFVGAATRASDEALAAERERKRESKTKRVTEGVPAAAQEKKHRTPAAA